MFGFLKKTKENLFNRKKFGKFFCSFWNNHFGLFFVFFSIIIISLGSYIWYRNVYLDRWDSEEKNKYKSDKNEEADFKEQLFRNVIEMSNKRREIYEKESGTKKDIFASYIKIESSSKKQEEKDASSAESISQNETNFSSR